MRDLGAVQVAVGDIYVDFRAGDGASVSTEHANASTASHTSTETHDIFDLPSGADPEDGDAYWRRRPIPARSR